MHIPGHTLGLVAVRLDDEYLFAGDSIFIRSIARPDLGGKAQTWAPLHGRSLRRLLTLPDRTVVLPGHFSGLDEADEGGLFAAPLAGLKRRNDGLLALQKESEEGFVRYLMEGLPKFIPEYVDIKRVNTGLLSPDRQARAGAGAESAFDRPRLRRRLPGMGEGGEERRAAGPGDGDDGWRQRLRPFREARHLIPEREIMEHSTIPDTRERSLEDRMRGVEERLPALEERLAGIDERSAEDRVALVVFSGDLDRVLAAFVIATGAAAMGQQVSMFFTFWGLSVLKKSTDLQGKSFFQKAMAVMSPGSSESLPVSKMNYFGVGAKMLRTMMKQRNVTSLEGMMALARELGVRMIACEMSRDVMGIKPSELQDGLECGGVAAFLADSLKSRTSLFI
jgi:peroxiredoxin family protein